VIIRAEINGPGRQVVKTKKKKSELYTRRGGGAWGSARENDGGLNPTQSRSVGSVCVCLQNAPSCERGPTRVRNNDTELYSGRIGVKCGKKRRTVTVSNPTLEKKTRYQVRKPPRTHVTELQGKGALEIRHRLLRNLHGRSFSVPTEKRVRFRETIGRDHRQGCSRRWRCATLRVFLEGN